MARGFNKVILMGNLARDPEIRYTVDKRAMARFAVAVNNTWKDKNGELQESVDFIPVVVWGPQAENCERYLKKGSPVLVEGRIQVRSYEAKDGSGKRYATDVVAAGVTFLGSKRQEESSGSFGGDEGFGDSIRKDKRFGTSDEDFPMDISEIQNEEDADIPF